jgi:hypothetical protein
MDKIVVMVRNIPAALWSEAREAANAKGQKMGFWIAEAVRDKLKKEKRKA